MAIYHLSAKPVQRSRGESVVAGAAYRAADKLQDARLGKTEDYRRKQGVVVSVIIAPENAPEWVYNREQLWNRAELAEKRLDAQPAREIRLGLPHELTDGQRTDLVFNYARDMFVDSGMVADISIHRPDWHGDERNHHAHILLTMRELAGDEFSSKKQREWNRKDTLEYWREQWAEYQNDALEDAGYEERVDHRTLEAQGIDREPTKHLGKEASALERRGEKSDLGDRNRESGEPTTNLDQLVNELAAVEAELAQELAKEFLDTGILTDEEIENLPSDQEEEESPPSVPPLAREPELPQEPPPTVSIFDSPSSKKFECELREKGYIGEEFPDYPDLEEELEEPEPEEELAYTPLAFNESYPRMEAQPGVSIFDSPLSKRFEREIRECGEVQEYGLGKNWYDRTVAYWQDVYSGTSRFVKDTWQKYVRDRDKTPEREGEGGLLDDTVDRAKSFWQKYIKGSDEDPDRDDYEPER